MSNLKSYFEQSVKEAKEAYEPQLAKFKETLNIPSKDDFVKAYTAGKNYVSAKVDDFKQTETGQKLSDAYHAGADKVKQGIHEFKQTETGHKLSDAYTSSSAKVKETTGQVVKGMSRTFDSFLNQFQTESDDKTVESESNSFDYNA